MMCIQKLFFLLPLWIISGIVDCKTCVRPADIVFAIDASRSIWPPHFTQQLRFVEELIQSFEIGPDAIQIGAFTFGDKITPEFQLNTYSNKNDVLAAINRTVFAQGGQTYTHEALNYTRGTMFSAENGARDGLSHIVIVLTDGQSTIQPATLSEATKSKDSGIMVFGIGIGREVDAEELKEMVSPPSSQFLFLVPSFGDLETSNIKEQLGTRACEATTPTPENTTEASTAMPPTTTIKQTTTKSGPTTTERMQLDEEEIEEVCQGKPADVIFVLDKSSSIWIEDFNKQMKFVADVVNFLDVDPNKTRIGLITFSDIATVEFHLNNYSTKEEVKSAVISTEYTGGRTNTGDALRLLLEEGFTASNGARKGIAQIAVVVTDGLSRVPEITERNADAVKKHGIYVFAIGVGEYTDPKELRAIASVPSREFVFKVDSYEALTTIKNILAYKACEVKPIGQPSGDIVTCTAEGPTDIVFGFDISNIGGIDTTNIIDFVKNASGAFITESGTIQVGLARKDCPDNTESNDIQLGEFISRRDFVDAVGGTVMSKLSSLIRKIRLQSFQVANGGKPNAKKVLILVIPGNIIDLAKSRSEAMRAKFTNIEIFVIGVGKGLSKSDIASLASDPKMSHVFMVDSSAELDSLLQRFLLTICKGL